MKNLFKLSLFAFFIFLLVGCGETSLVNGEKVTDDNDDVEQPIIDEEKSYSVIFESNGGEVVSSQLVVEGDLILYPDNPTRDGYIFVQWHTSINLSDPFNRSSAVTSDLTLYAEWKEIAVDDVVITFESEYGNATLPIIGKPGDSIDEPVEPVDVFYDFIEWRIKGTNNNFDFSTMPDENITLEAVWEKNSTYELVFYINETEEYQTILFTSGTSIDLPNNPEIEDYVFIGWYMDDSFNIVFDAGASLPSDHVEVFGKFILIEDYFYSVTFDTSGGNTIDSQIKIIGEKVSEPKIPIRKGYIFEGWYTEEILQNAYDFNQTRNDDLTLYAKWTFDDDFTITNLIVSDQETITIVLDQAETRDLPELFEDGYIFDGWFTSQNYQVRYREYLYFAQPLGHELNLYAKWIEAPNVVYITLDTNGGTEGRFTAGGGIIKTGTIQANPNDGITIYSPYREGYDFSGWYTDSTLTNQVNPISYGYGISTQTISIPSENTTLYAKWVSKTTGEVDDGSTATDLTIIEKLEDFGFICDNFECVLEEYTNYNYIYDLEANTLSYVIDVDQISDGGYRNYDRILTVYPNYDIDYSYQVEENYGFLYVIEITIEGNYLTETYEVTYFDSNVTQEQTNYDKAMEFIENIVRLYEGITN